MHTYKIYKMDTNKKECVAEWSHSEKQIMTRFEFWKEKYNDTFIFVIDDKGVILATNTTMN